MLRHTAATQLIEAGTPRFVHGKQGGGDAAETTMGPRMVVIFPPVGQYVPGVGQ